MKTHGDEGWQDFPSYFELVVPRILQFLKDRQLNITVFVVGKDASLEKNHASLKSIAEAGHEIGNHSFHHEPWLHLYSPEKLNKEFEDSEQAILHATGQKPIGFRGPGFSLSDQVLKTLVDRGYLYDCSTFPTYLGPLARMYYFLTAKFNREQKEERKQLFGKFSDGFQPLRPFEWDLGKERLLEIPVTTMPIFKTPIHLSYIHYLSQFSTLIAKLYFRQAAFLCKTFGVGPSLLLHPLDFLGADDKTGLEYFPGMKLRSDKKIQMNGWITDCLAKKFDLVCMKDHAAICKTMHRPQRSIQYAPVGTTN